MSKEGSSSDRCMDERADGGTVGRTAPRLIPMEPGLGAVTPMPRVNWAWFIGEYMRVTGSPEAGVESASHPGLLP